ncbi:MAG: hypothetical protein QW775_05525 [Ignisphaera sp.]|uniref:DUF1616 domain-containing protein n=1 Tax=Ignisphaera aggregans TaxID=334771 RepID=A0A7C4NLS9_9CREN
MYATLKLGVTLVSILVTLGLLYPIIIFGLEISHNPYLLPISVNILDYNLSLQIVVIELSVLYRGSIPLNDFYVKFLNKEFFVGDLSKGDKKTIRIEIELKNIEEIPKRVEIEFKIAKLYTFRIISEGGVVG